MEAPACGVVVREGKEGQKGVLEEKKIVIGNQGGGVKIPEEEGKRGEGRRAVRRRERLKNVSDMGHAIAIDSTIQSPKANAKRQKTRVASWIPEQVNRPSSDRVCVLFSLIPESP